MSVSGSARRFGLEDSVMRVAECGAGAGAMIMRAVMGSIGGNVGPIAHPAHSAGREPKLGAGAAGDECLPWMLTGGVERVHHEKRSVSQGAEGEASNRAKKVKSAGGITNAGPKEAAPVVAALKDVFVAFGRLAIAVEGTNEGAQDDEEAEARDAQRKYLAARAAVKGAGRGAEGGTSKSAEIIQTPMVGIRVNPGQKNPFIMVASTSISTLHVCVGLYLDCEKARQAAKKRGTRGRCIKGDAGEKVVRKGEEAEHDDEDDDENDTILLGGSESNEELA
ncbi:unnamed protein product [Closterium sp. NIES-54]